jgi:hypothetical protein
MDLNRLTGKAQDVRFGMTTDGKVVTTQVLLDGGLVVPVQLTVQPLCRPVNDFRREMHH